VTVWVKSARHTELVGGRHVIQRMGRLPPWGKTGRPLLVFCGTQSTQADLIIMQDLL